MKSSVDLAMRKRASGEMLETSGEDFMIVLTLANGSVTIWLSNSASLFFESLVGEVVVVVVVVVVAISSTPIVISKAAVTTE